MKKLLILASASPRRKQWMDTLKIPYEVIIPDIDETPHPRETARDLVLRLAEAKAREVSRFSHQAWILAADTTVTIDGNLLNKPSDAIEACSMLSQIQGRTHEVHTGCCLKSESSIDLIHDVSEVTFRPMTQRAIEWYVATGEPLDKAGGYAIQGQGALFIAGVSGSYATVMGLPIEKLIPCLRDKGLLKLWRELPD